MALNQCKHFQLTTTLEDLNAKTDNETMSGLSGGYGLGEMNPATDTLVAWVDSHDFIESNTWFKHHHRRSWTWKSSDDKVLKISKRLEVVYKQQKLD